MVSSIPIKIGQAARQTVHPVLGDINHTIDGVKIFRFNVGRVGWSQFFLHGTMAFAMLLAFSVLLSQPAGISTADINGPLRPGRGKPPAQRTDLSAIASTLPTPPTSSTSTPAGSPLQPTAQTPTPPREPLLSVSGTPIVVYPPEGLPPVPDSILPR